MICAMSNIEHEIPGSHDVHGERPPAGQVPAEYLVDNVTSGIGLRKVWERFRDAQHILTDAIEGNKHIVAKVGPAGRIVIISSVGVAGTIGGIYLCKRLLKHRHNPRTEKH